MRRRTLPTAAEAAEILGRKRTRPIRRPPPPIGKSLSKPLKALEERFGTGADGLAARWREIVGEILARRTEPVKLTKPRGGGSATLEIRVDGPAAALIQHQAPEILSRVNLFLGTGAVAKLRIVQGPVKLHASAGPASTAKSKAKSAPLDAAQEAALAESLAGAPEKLKKALTRLGRAVLRDE